jgi:glycosyltransferase involved in cell wall biosynthesis
MACGRPVIGAAVGGISYTVRDGETGLLVPPRRPELLAEAIASLLADEPRRLAMGRAARRRVTADFSWANSGHRLHELYRRILAPATAPGEARPAHDDNSSLAGSYWSAGLSVSA